ncbi:uncharacterized protein EI90DRAFT_3018896 [Cantharellus anzutake]|uniref:uncharacterized protein n=1 Tax=Cantharellus anzutake TaxID=1750568 RepID=UPI0019038763|nr:uncharacterized protein EI90DRAFT_3018896 [Cantharellus anzutake]KAF8325833.1 hypothetical protein EI90DRAFT_3018896 [Cantharellus anzutake]
MEDTSERVCPCCGTVGLSERTIRRHLQSADLSVIDALRVSPEREIDTPGSDAYESPDNNSIDFSCDSQHFSSPDSINPHSLAHDETAGGPDPVDSLRKLFSDLSLVIESHPVPEMLEDCESVGDELDEPLPVDEVDINDSDEDSVVMDESDSMELDEELQDMYNFSK